MLLKSTVPNMIGFQQIKLRKNFVVVLNVSVIC